MLVPFLFKPTVLAMICASFLALTGCKSSEFSDIFERCAPECTKVESTVPIAEVKNAFTQVVESIEVSTLDLTGRWLMLSASRYSINESQFRSFTDLLFTKSMVFTQVGDSIHVSDCYNTEIYPLNSLNGFTIPKDSVFFSSLYFENKNAIVVKNESNKLLSADWAFTTPQNTAEQVKVNMYKINDSASATEKFGVITTTTPVASEDDIYCYSYLHVFTSAEQLFGNQWIPGNYEIKEMLLKTDPASGDENVALASKVSNGVNPEYKIIYNQNIEFEEYECFGNNNMESASGDYLTFVGEINITTLDSFCDKPISEGVFEFSIQ